MMELPKLRASWLVAALCAVSGGCAQCQQGDQLPAGGIDARLYETLAHAFGERPSRAAAPQAGRREAPSKRGAVQQAEYEESLTAPVSPESEPELQPAETVLPEPVASCAPAEGCCSSYCDSTGCGCCADCPLVGGCHGGKCKCACLDCLERRLCSRPQPGPPPVRYRPEMPPKFLPTPTAPVWPPARPDAPEPWRGDIEVPYYGVQLVSPGRD